MALTERRSHALTNYTSIHVYADETSVDIANNRSYVSTELWIYVTQSYSASNVNTNVTGSNPYTNSFLSLSSGWTKLVSGGFWANHNSDGTGSATVGSYYTSGYGTMGYDEFTIPLSTIPRATTPNCGTGTTGQTLTINTPRASDKFTHTVSYSFGNKSGTIKTGVGTSCTWTIPMDLETQIPNASSGTGAITCVTYNGSTNIGTKTCTLKVNASSVPSIGTITANENNAKVKAKADNITVQSISSKTISVSISGTNGSTIKKVTLNGNIALTNTSGSTWSVTAGNPQNGNYMIEATDSRGRKSSKSLAQTFYAYSRPSVSATLKREGETSANGTLSVNGKYSTVLSNTVSMTIKRNDESSATNVTPSLSSGSASFSKTYTDLSYVSSFSIVVNMTDSFGEIATTTVYLGVGQYSLWIGKYDLKVGGNINANGSLTLGGSANVSKTVTASDFKIANASSAVPHLVGSAWYFDKTINNVTVKITASLCSHRFVNMSIYDSNYVQKVVDGDGFCSVKILKKGMYLIPFKIQGSNVGGANGTIFYGYSINANAGSGQWGWNQYDQRTSLYACSFSTAFVKVLNEGDVLRWQVCGDNSRTVEGIEMWLIHLAS